jgi:hypothetical protein
MSMDKKSDEHRRRFSEGLEERHKRLSAGISSLKRRIDAFDRDRSKNPVDELVDLLETSISIAAEGAALAQDVGDERVEHAMGELYKTRRRAVALGDRFHSADLLDLRLLANAGLVDHEEVEAEARKRVAAHGAKVSLSQHPGQVSDAVVAGELPCGHPSCEKVVPASEGYCAEHKRSVPRAFLTADYRARNLDDELIAAKLEHKKAREALEAATEQLEAVQAAVERWDATHSDG